MRDTISREYFSEANTYRIKVFTDSYHIYETLKCAIEKYCSELEKPKPLCECIKDGDNNEAD